MKRGTLAVFLLLTMPVAVLAQGRAYEPFSEYEMTPESEIALARSAAPERISSRATIKVLTRNGYEVAVEGDNGFVCMVMRSWSAAESIAPVGIERPGSPACRRVPKWSHTQGGSARFIKSAEEPKSVSRC